jgi:hypothetical protein
LSGKISNHILIFGFNDGIIHFIKATRQKCEMPIAFLSNDDISTEIFKLNNIYGNVYHFWGDPFDKQNLEKSCISEAFAVIVLTDHSEKGGKIMDDGYTIKVVRMIE